MEKISLTNEEIRFLFDAGVSCGRDEAISYDWGVRAEKDRLEAILDALQDILYERRRSVLPKGEYPPYPSLEEVREQFGFE